MQEDCLLNNTLANRSKTLDKGRVEKQAVVKRGTDRISAVETKRGLENGNGVKTQINTVHEWLGNVRHGTPRILRNIYE